MSMILSEFSPPAAQVVQIKEQILGHPAHWCCILEKQVFVTQKFQKLPPKIFLDKFYIRQPQIEFVTEVLFGREAASSFLLSFLCRDILFLASKAAGVQTQGEERRGNCWKWNRVLNVLKVRQELNRALPSCVFNDKSSTISGLTPSAFVHDSSFVSGMLQIMLYNLMCLLVLRY